MKTKVRFTIYWKPVIAVAFLSWGAWVTYVLIGFIETQSRMAIRLDYLWRQ